ncbi:hypothetical protein EB796_014310 [Bugula neritina]|uniref:Uncharacterized protein n=1 Tax=Bugula neritina TaxID=10212 RepID=A0A7J7JMW4_BUGNE|nr:hypothetical protein EB796_014310 [Bugula neritina]
MAGGERYLEVEEDELDPPAHLSTVTSATTSLARLSCADKVTSVQNVTCFVTILPTLEKVESIKTYLERMIRERGRKMIRAGRHIHTAADVEHYIRST